MVFPKLAKAAIPRVIARPIGDWALAQVSQGSFRAWKTVSYVKAIHGYDMTGIRLMDGYCIYHGIKAPLDSLYAFIEIFGDRIYDCRMEIPKGGTVIDIGAHVGVFTQYAAE